LKTFFSFVRGWLHLKAWKRRQQKGRDHFKKDIQVMSTYYMYFIQVRSRK
jgi:hypothetical protein